MHTGAGAFSVELVKAALVVALDRTTSKTSGSLFEAFGASERSHASDIAKRRATFTRQDELRIHDRAYTTRAQKALVKVFGSVSSDFTNTSDRSMLHCKRSCACRLKGAVYRYKSRYIEGFTVQSDPQCTGTLFGKCTAKMYRKSTFSFCTGTCTGTLCTGTCLLYTSDAADE